MNSSAQLSLRRNSGTVNTLPDKNKHSNNSKPLYNHNSIDWFMDGVFSNADSV